MRSKSPSRRFSFCRYCLSGVALILALTSYAVSAKVTVDGHVARDEWLDAQLIVDFRKLQPLNGAPARLAVEAWALSTLERSRGHCVSRH